MKFFSVLFWGCLALAVAASVNRDRMPSKSEISSALLQAPLQAGTSVAPFSFDHKGKRYTVTPRFSYELWGLVVSCHGSNDPFDYYHEKWGDDLNVKDLCVIWGGNVKNEVWRWMRFKSGSWTCYPLYRSGFWEEAERVYRGDCLSNNHLLARDASVAKRLLRMRRGDQVHIKGLLVEYAHSGGKFRRGTSTVRDDEGNGACETVFVTQADILRVADPFWRSAFPVFFAGIFISLIGWFVTYMRETGRSYDRDQQS